MFMAHVVERMHLCVLTHGNLALMCVDVGVNVVLGIWR